jgi:hypothetical protein
LTPASLPNGPADISVAYGADGTLTLTWDVPTDTGGGEGYTGSESSIAASTLKYMLEVDEGFHNGTSLDGYVALTSTGSSNPHTAVTYTHANLIMGHTYTYRVKAQNLMGYGAYNPTPRSFIPRVVPAAPPLAPRNVLASSTRSVLYLEFDEVLDNGGSPITSYMVEIDDGTDSDAFTAYNAGTLLTFDTQSANGGTPISMTAGLTYRAKYRAVNDAGTGPLSPEVQILLAEVPGPPANVRRINTDTLPAGHLSIAWDLPTDNGANPVVGYVIYLDNVVHHNTSNYDSALNEYTFTTLTVGRVYTIGTSARNLKGEGVQATVASPYTSDDNWLDE